MAIDQTQISKLLSYVLRHKPESVGITLDNRGWADTDELLSAIQKEKFSINLEALKSIVKSSDKQRFKFNDDYSKIRANQGHSITIDLNLPSKIPPQKLYHGTASKNLESIRKQGLLKQQRHHVHLSEDKKTAHSVGSRYGKPVILTIDSGAMHNDGILFYQSENGVWLTEIVKPTYINFPE